ncbi:MAG: UDP-N-acetylmuramoyl-L-alanyl-D-glutamate--2,6-diaminopimelate ligase [Candidatus Riflebacteria bacterium]|nr:UDP-N-acetylmuramoyl-L-alanyl-D-glutamate--2,6-diaminopimelate ligase [Candidatus Riflebacteria bacterium]
MNNLKSILPKDILEISNDKDVQISDISFDSRTVKLGDLFVALPGSKADGTKFVPEAVAKGAAAVVCESIPAKTGIPCVKLANARKALSEISSKFFDHPDKKATILGVTGTKGKTTTTYLIQSILNNHFGMAFRFGTIEYDLWFEKRPTKNTTPESLELFRLINDCLKRSVKAGVMEISSHALKTWRVENISLAAAGFSNLSFEHSEFHPTMEDYFQAKMRLFTELLPENAPATICIDDEWGVRLAKVCLEKGRKTFTFSLSDQAANYFAWDVVLKNDGSTFNLDARGKKIPVRLKLPGPFNLKNALLASVISHSIGIDWETIVDGLAKVSSVPGRFESIPNKMGIMVVVDYAHSPDSLENVLLAARQMTKKRLITVFGCGGDRSKEKRPLMGNIAASHSDIVVITSDNPRSEDPEKIICEISAGIEKLNPIDRPKYHRIVDRRSAIEAAIGMANSGDFVLIAGKGHETGQTFSDRTVPFDDRQVAAEIVGNVGKNS